jgi:hypothetical protein
LPLVNYALQAIVDASGGGPQRIRRRQLHCEAASSVSPITRS